MPQYSTREAAKKLGISHEALANYVRVGKVSAPEAVQHGRRLVHIWSDEEIEQVRTLLPKIANGRKTRYQKKHSAVISQQLAKTKTKSNPKNPQPRAAVPHKKTKPKKSKPPRSRPAG